MQLSDISNDKRQAEAGLTEALEQRYASGSVPGRNGQSFGIEPAGMRQSQGERIADMVQAERASLTIETGFALGLSGLFMSLGAMRGGAQIRQHVAMDPGEADRWQDAGIRSFEDAGIAECLEFYNERSEHVLPRLLEEARRFDVGFVDGDHRFESVMSDLMLIGRIVKPSGLVIVDDTWMPSVRTAVGYFVNNCGWVTQPQLGDDPAAWSRRQLPWQSQRRREREWSANMAVLRTPAEGHSLGWDAFEPFSVG